MPKPPNPSAFDQLNFIVNYYLIGCTPDFWLFIEFAKEPAEDLLLLLLLPDLEDIGQAIFEPKKGRKRKPGRHGRKKRRGIGIPDTSDIIGQKARGAINPADVFKYSPVRRVFPLYNLVEGVNFGAAVVEGVTDTFYQGHLGNISVNRNDCQELDRIQRSDDTPQVQGGSGPPLDPILLRDLDFVRNFGSGNMFIRHDTKPYTVSFNMVVQPTQEDPDNHASAALGSGGTQIKYQGNRNDFAGLETRTLRINGDYEAGEVCNFGFGERFGFYRVLSASILAYTTADFPWPWE